MGRVVDANMMVAAQPVQSLLLRVQQPVLSWTFSRPSSEPYVTFRVNFERSLPAGQDVVRFAAVLLQIPEGFFHVITSPLDVVNLNSRFPLMQDWVQFDRRGMAASYFGPDLDPRKVRILRDETKRVPAGTMGWAFPVSVPLRLPADNIWRLALCSVPSCNSTNDTPSIAVSFVIPGFLHNEVSVVQGYDPESLYSFARRSGSRCIWLLAAVFGAIVTASG